MNRTLRSVVLVTVATAAIWFFFIRDTSVHLGDGIHAPNPPVQQNIQDQPFFFHGEYVVTPLASFEVEAKVLSRKDYSWGREAELSPIDLALGWGRMSDESVLEHFDISQSGRWYYWRTDRMVIPRNEIQTSSANMHLIPSNDKIAEMLDEVREGEVIQFKGKLVKVESGDGWRWISSTTRNDRGNGSCELVWVEELDILLTESS